MAFQVPQNIKGQAEFALDLATAVAAGVIAYAAGGPIVEGVLPVSGMIADFTPHAVGVAVGFTAWKVARRHAYLK